MFDFIEIENESKLNIKHNQFTVIDIPEEQYINLLDLINIEPDINLLKLINKSILEKYNIIPLFILENNIKPNIPKHFDSKYWGIAYNKNNNKCLYIALENNFDSIILNIIQNITNYSVISIPIKKQTVLDFYKMKLKKEEKENIYNFNFFIKENLLYIFFFLFILILLILVKLYLL